LILGLLYEVRLQATPSQIKGRMTKSLRTRDTPLCNPSLLSNYTNESDPPRIAAQPAPSHIYRRPSKDKNALT